MNSYEFKIFFETYYYTLCVFARRYVSSDDASEIVQDLMVWYWIHHEQLVLEGPEINYLLKAVKNRAINICKKQSNFTKVSNVIQKKHPIFEDPDCYVVSDLSHQITTILEKMPPEFREVFEYNRYQNQSYSQIAAKLNVSIQTVNYRMTQALKILRAGLKEYL